MVSFKTIEADGVNKKFLSEFTIKSENHVVVFVTDTDPENTIPAEYVSTDSWALINNYVEFYNPPAANTYVSLLVSTEVEELTSYVLVGNIGRAKVPNNIWNKSTNDSIYGLNYGMLYNHTSYNTTLSSNAYRNIDGNLSFLGADGYTNSGAMWELYPNGEAFFKSGYYSGSGVDLPTNISISNNGSVTFHKVAYFDSYVYLNNANTAQSISLNSPDSVHASGITFKIDDINKFELASFNDFFYIRGADANGFYSDSAIKIHRSTNDVFLGKALYTKGTWESPLVLNNHTFLWDDGVNLRGKVGAMPTSNTDGTIIL